MMERHDVEGLSLPEQPTRHLVTIENVPRRIRMFSISEDELNRLTAGYSSIDQTLFGVAFGSLVSVGIVFLTVKLEGNPLSIFVALAAVAALASLFFGGRVVLGRRDMRKELARLKQAG